MQTSLPSEYNYPIILVVDVRSPGSRRGSETDQYIPRFFTNFLKICHWVSLTNFDTMNQWIYVAGLVVGKCPWKVQVNCDKIQYDLQQIWNTKPCLRRSLLWSNPYSSGPTLTVVITFNTYTSTCITLITLDRKNRDPDHPLRFEIDKTCTVSRLEDTKDFICLSRDTIFSVNAWLSWANTSN